MKIYVLFFLISLFIVNFNIFADDRISKLDWNGVEVIWLQDQNFPTYDFVVYFADGALSDQVGGETDTMFNLLTYGTRRFEQKDISDHLEFYGVSHSSEVTHEYSIFHVSGLTKDLKPTMKMVCHLFSDATFPDQELSRFKTIRKDRLNNMINSQSALGSRAFRALSMEGTPFAAPMQGRLKDADRWTSKALKEKLNYFNTQVAKKIYISGPHSVLEVRDIITKECNWSKSASFVRNAEAKERKVEKKPTIHLVTVPNATQAYIYLGRFLDKKEIGNLEMLELVSGFLGGGFSSKLMQEIRVKRGLSYGAEATALGQRNYGRLVISTYTKNQSVIETLGVIKTTLEDVVQGKFEDKELETAREGIVGSYPFRFEKSTAYLDQLIYFDHIGRQYDDIYRFPEGIKKINKSDLIKSASSLLNWDQLNITIIGQKDLADRLKEFGEVKVSSYQDYL